MCCGEAATHLPFVLPSEAVLVSDRRESSNPVLRVLFDASKVNL